TARTSNPSWFRQAKTAWVSGRRNHGAVATLGRPGEGGGALLVTGLPCFRRVKPFIEIAQDGSGGSPNVPPLIFHGIEPDAVAPPIAELLLVVFLFHKKRERHFEDFGDLAGIRHRLNGWVHDGKHRNDAKACACIVKVEQA